MINERKSEETEISTSQLSEVPPQPVLSNDDGEFKVTVRKLEMPVQPRGVLAE